MRDEAANSPADEGGDASGAGATGLGSQDQGPVEDADQALLRADERGDAAAARSVGLLLERRGDLAGAEAAYRRADRRGTPREQSTSVACSRNEEIFRPPQSPTGVPTSEASLPPPRA
jgi:hypothetical protein